MDFQKCRINKTNELKNKINGTKWSLKEVRTHVEVRTWSAVQ